MPRNPYSSDCLQPQLTDAERNVVKSYGGWSSFSYSFGLKPWEPQEGKQMAQALASDVQTAASGSSSGSSNHGKK